MKNGIDHDIIKIAIEDAVISLIQSHGGVQEDKGSQGRESRNPYFRFSQMSDNEKSDAFGYLDDLSERISVEFSKIIEEENKKGKILPRSDFRRILLQSMENNNLKPEGFDRWTRKIFSHEKKIFIISNPDFSMPGNHDIVLRQGNKGDNEIHFSPSQKKFEKYFRPIHKDIGTIAAALFKIEYLMKTQKIKPTDFKLICCSPQMKNGKETLSRISSFLLDYKTEWDVSIVPSEISSKDCDISAPAICLFSGGIDSLAGFLVSRELWNGTVGLYVGHNMNAGHFVKRVSKSLKNARILQVNVQRSGLFLQQTRGLLYMLSGAIYADLLQSEHLIVSECGATMYQPPLTPSDEITRTVHPKLITLLKDFLDETLERKINISVPFRHLTKAEVIASMLKANHNQTDILKETFSCRHTIFGKAHGNCGYCYGCLLRHLSMELLDIPEGHFLDPLRLDIGQFATRKKPDKDGKIRKYWLDHLKMENIIQLINLATELFKETSEWPEHILTYFNQLGEEPKQIYDLYRRLAKDILFGIWRMRSQKRLRNSIILKMLSEIEKKDVFSEEDVFQRRKEILEGRFPPRFV